MCAANACAIVGSEGGGVELGRLGFESFRGSNARNSSGLRLSRRDLLHRLSQRNLTAEKSMNRTWEELWTSVDFENKSARIVVYDVTF